MFTQSFAIDAGEFWNTVKVAGSYLGVNPD